MGYLPASGYLYTASGTFSSVSLYGYEWSSSRFSAGQNAHFLFVDATNVFLSNSHHRPSGLSIRCVQEEKRAFLNLRRSRSGRQPAATRGEGLKPIAGCYLPLSGVLPIFVLRTVYRGGVFSRGGISRLHLRWTRACNRARALLVVGSLVRFMARERSFLVAGQSYSSRGSYACSRVECSLCPKIYSLMNTRFTRADIPVKSDRANHNRDRIASNRDCLAF